MPLRAFAAHLRRYLLAGVLTVIPLWVTWLILAFVFRQLSALSLPWLLLFSTRIQQEVPVLSLFLRDSRFQSALAVLLSLLALYLLGAFATRVVGQRLVALGERLIQRLPLVQTIYGGTKKMLSALSQPPVGVRRVVLISFPSRDMKTLGLVTRTLRDHRTGRELAAVYVPTTPNPTSGYLEIVPVDQLVNTDWTMDEAMAFVMSGGAVAPENIPFDGEAPPLP
ncbi:DUF502 domain-containing protein [Immundisolibacter sp.]|uniref:DUF502 domain-containing protein n=1 Tax=Immundisolibacter sp. TaxID=1934948 RepID=UPI00356AB894